MKPMMKWPGKFYTAKNVGKNTQLSEKTMKEIEEARKRIEKGSFYTEEEVREILGFLPLV